MPWHELARGIANDTESAKPTAFVALDRTGTSRFSARLPAAGRNALARLDFRRTAAVAVFGEFGCRDHRVAVVRIVQRAATLVVSLVERPLAPGTFECQALYPTYRLLAVAKADLGRPFPTAAEVRLARP
jgi:hypothetical protein